MVSGGLQGFEVSLPDGLVIGDSKIMDAGRALALPCASQCRFPIAGLHTVWSRPPRGALCLADEISRVVCGAELCFAGPVPDRSFQHASKIASAC